MSHCVDLGVCVQVTHTWEGKDGGREGEREVDSQGSREVGREGRREGEVGGEREGGRGGR